MLFPKPLHLLLYTYHACLLAAQIDLSHNGLCGLTNDFTGRITGIFNAEGIKAIASAISTSASLKEIDLRSNSLCGVRYGQGTYNADGLKAIAQAISVSASLTSIDLTGNDFGPEGAQHIAEGISVSASLTSIDLSRNKIGSEGAKHIAKGIAESASLTQVFAL